TSYGTAYGSSGHHTALDAVATRRSSDLAKFTNVPGGTANWTFTDVTGNYNNQSGSVAIVIEKADATVSVAGTTETYDGTAYGASAYATGEDGEELARLDLGAKFTNVQGG